MVSATKRLNVLAYPSYAGSAVPDEIHIPGPDLVRKPLTEKMLITNDVTINWQDTLDDNTRGSAGESQHGINNYENAFQDTRALTTKVALNVIDNFLRQTEDSHTLLLGGDHSSAIGHAKGQMLGDFVCALLDGHYGNNPILFDTAHHIISLLRNDNIELVNDTVNDLINNEIIDVEQLQQEVSRYHVMWFDAHPDFAPNYEIGRSRNLHCMALNIVNGGGPEELRHLGHEKLRINNIWGIGWRQIHEDEFNALGIMYGKEKANRLNWESIEKHPQKLEGAINDMLITIPDDARIILEIDIDFFPTGFCSSTDTPVSFDTTLSRDDFTNAFSGLANDPRIVSTSIGEIYSDKGNAIQTCDFITDIAYALYQGNRDLPKTPTIDTPWAKPLPVDECVQTDVHTENKMMSLLKRFF